MTANLELAKERNLSIKDVIHINNIHDALELLIDTYSLECDLDTTLDLVEQAEYALQRLWKFTEDRRYHTWCRRLILKHMNLTWKGVVVECQSTKEQCVITKNQIKERFHVGCGEGFLDITPYYHRVVGPLTITQRADQDGVQE